MVARAHSGESGHPEEHESFGFLFSDVQVIALKQPDDLKLLVESRISNYRAAEAAKTAAAEEARAAKAQAEEETSTYRSGCSGESSNSTHHVVASTTTRSG